MPAPFTVRWGILGPGMIATVYANDLVLDPKTRGVEDIIHSVQAVASATSVDRAKKFLQDVGAPSGTAYGSYEELVSDPNVDIVYVATPHSHHFAHCILALNAGKPVVCEKAFTVNAEQTKILVNLARSKKLFLMEAVWTRFFPISVEIRELVKNKSIGDVKRVLADLSLAQAPETKYDDSHRVVNPDLAGGVLLDLGIYSLTWVYQILYHTLPDSEKVAPVVNGVISKYERTGVDIENVVVCKFPSSIGIATSSVRVATDPDESGYPGIRIQGTEGEIRVDHPAWAPAGYSIVPLGKGSKVERFERPVPAGKGMYWEADEAARCLRDGKLESEIMSLDESILIMEAMDTVRVQSGLRYPEGIESTNLRFVEKVWCKDAE